MLLYRVTSYQLNRAKSGIIVTYFSIGRLATNWAKSGIIVTQFSLGWLATKSGKIVTLLYRETGYQLSQKWHNTHTPGFHGGGGGGPTHPPWKSPPLRVTTNHIQSNLDPFGQLQNPSVRISKKFRQSRVAIRCMANLAHTHKLVYIRVNKHFDVSSCFGWEYCIAPNFRGTILTWLLWFDFWSQKLSSWKFSMLMVGMATCCAAQRVLVDSEHWHVCVCTCFTATDHKG